VHWRPTTKTKPFYRSDTHSFALAAVVPEMVPRADQKNTRREMKAARYLNWRINRRVNAEDTELVARVQQGMASRWFEPGPLSETEACLRGFARRLRALIPEARLRHPPADWST
jgi:phenylpropionate dioxygenase-like ring-hydroxylating dioxygenase large terminal subunit